MTQGIGRLIQIGVAKETTRGTSPSSATYWVPYADGSQIEEKYQNVMQDQAYGVIEDNIGQFRVKNWAEAKITGPVSDVIFPIFMLSLLGTDTPTGPTDSTYTHPMTVAETATHQSLSLYRHDPVSGQDRVYANAVVSKMSLEYALGKYVTYTATLLAQQGVTHAAYSPATTSENRFVPQYLTFKVAPSLAGVNGTLTGTGTAATTIHVTALSINTNLLRIGMTVTGTNVPANTTIAAIVSATAFDLSAATTGAVGTMTFGAFVLPVMSAKIDFDASSDAYQPLGTVTPSDFFNKEFKVTGQLELLWKNETDMKINVLAGTASAMILDLLNADVLLGATTHPEYTVLLNKVIFTEIGQAVKLKDMLSQTLKFTAAYSTTDSSMVTSTMVNTVATY